MAGVSVNQSFSVRCQPSSVCHLICSGALIKSPTATSALLSFLGLAASSSLLFSLLLSLPSHSGFPYSLPQLKDTTRKDSSTPLPPQINTPVSAHLCASGPLWSLSLCSPLTVQLTSPHLSRDHTPVLDSVLHLPSKPTVSFPSAYAHTFILKAKYLTHFM